MLSPKDVNNLPAIYNWNIMGSFLFQLIYRFFPEKIILTTTYFFTWFSCFEDVYLHIIPICFWIWLLNALLLIVYLFLCQLLVPLSFMELYYTLYFIWENSKFFSGDVQSSTFCIDHSFFPYTIKFLYVLPFLQTITGLCADLAQLAGANILEGEIFSRFNRFLSLFWALSNQWYGMFLTMILTF